MVGIFKRNDIRGVYGKDINEEIVRKIGYYFGSIIEPHKFIAVAGDSRISTPALTKAFCEGFLLSGSNIYDLGLGPSSLIYYVAAKFDEIDAGVMITASHNPPRDNGVKICDGFGAPYHYDNLYKQIEEKIKGLTIPKEEIKKGRIINGKKYKDDYIDFLKNHFKFHNRLNIVVEHGNGATGIFSKLLREIGHNVNAIRKEPDGTFPTLLPDPTKEKTYDKIKEQLNKEIDLGIAFDGDGDRIGFITNQGEIISPDKAIMLFGEFIKENKPDNHVKIIIDVKISKATADYLNKLGIQVSLTQVGHSWVYENLINSKSDFAGELSCHYYFNYNYYGFDDGLYAALIMLKIMDDFKNNKIDIQEKLDSLPKYPSTPEFRIPIPYDKQDLILEMIRKFVISNKGKLIQIDGIRGEFEYGWFIVRKSGTEEVLSYRVEGIREQDKRKLLDEIQSIINGINIQ